MKRELNFVHYASIASFLLCFCMFFGPPALDPTVFAQENLSDPEEDEQTALFPEGKIEPYDLRLEFLTEPRGIDELEPRFSWKLRCVEGLEEKQRAGQCQSAYRIVVYKIKRTSPTLSQPTDTVWDSGKIESTSQLVEYAGKSLEPKSEYIWTLTVWDKPVEILDENKKVAGETKPLVSGRPSNATVATFSTGLFATKTESNPWKGRWIGLDKFSLEDHGEKKDSLKLDGASWIWLDEKGPGAAQVGKFSFRKEFDLPVDLVPTDSSANRCSAEAAFAADNGYTLYVNGEKIGSGSNFKTANRFNVADKLKPGKNVLAFEVSNHGDDPNPAGLIGVLKIQVADEKTIEIKTDASWKVAEGWKTDFAQPNFDAATWKPATKIADLGGGPWGEISVANAWPCPPARYLTKDFETKKDLVRATAYIAGLGYYELYLNGIKIGDHCLDPVLTDYDKRVPYVAYELASDNFSEFFQHLNGTTLNKLEIVLGNGRYYAPRNNEPMTTRHFGYPKTLFQLELEYKDGSKETVVSDETWKLSTDGPIRDNNDYDGEIFDARKKLKIEYKDHAEIVEAPKGKLVAQMMPPMRTVEEFEPISVTEVKPGVWIFDFGVNLVGNCRFNPSLDWKKSNELTTVVFRHAETLQTEGSDKGTLYVDNLRGAKCRDIYITDGRTLNGDQYAPTFAYHGFRYAEITGLPQGFKPTKQTLKARAINTDLPKVGIFETSDKTINAIYRNVVRGTQGNYLSIPTDCPQRDERQGWQGDRAGESKGEMFLFDNITLYAKWLQDIEDSQQEDGNVSDVCPNFWPLYGSNVTWPSAQTIIPDSILTMYGDRRPIERHYDSMKRWLIDHLGPFVQDGIIDKDNYGDWCVPPEKPILIHSQDPARKTSKAVLATAYYIHNLDLLAKFAGMLGKDDEARNFAAQADDMRKAFNDKFLDKVAGRYDNGTQTSCVLPLRFDIVPEDAKANIFATLINNIETVTDFHIGTGLIGGQWINRVLSDGGRADISYRFATNKTYPSWGYMVENGATTIWELWNGNTADPAMNSGNHVMLVGDLAIWFYEHLAGIKADPEKPGFEHIIMRPTPIGDLTFVDAEYNSVRGPIRSRWERNGNDFYWEIEIPVGSTATVHVPGGATGMESKTVPSGKHVFKSTL